MENPRLIKKRIQSVKNIRKITKALEMVSASKVRASQIRARAGKPYSQKVYELVSELSGKADGEKIDLFEKGKGQKRRLRLRHLHAGWAEKIGNQAGPLPQRQRNPASSEREI